MPINPPFQVLVVDQGLQSVDGLLWCVVAQGGSLQRALGVQLLQVGDEVSQALSEATAVYVEQWESDNIQTCVLNPQQLVVSLQQLGLLLC